MKNIIQFDSILSFSTERLICKAIQASDFDRLMEMHTNPEVMKTIGGIRTEAKTREYLQQSIDHWVKHQFGLWMFYLKETGEWVGRGGLRWASVDGHDEVEVTYAIMPTFWGKELTTEFASACSEIAFEKMGLDDIVCFTLVTNKASQRVMEKVGFVYEKDFSYFDQPCVLYRMNKF